MVVSGLGDIAGRWQSLHSMMLAERGQRDCGLPVRGTCDETPAHQNSASQHGKGGSVTHCISSEMPLISSNFRKKSQVIIFPDRQVPGAILFGLVA